MLISSRVLQGTWFSRVRVPGFESTEYIFSRVQGTEFFTTPVTVSMIVDLGKLILVEDQ